MRVPAGSLQRELVNARDSFPNARCDGVRREVYCLGQVEIAGNDVVRHGREEDEVFAA